MVQGTNTLTIQTDHLNTPRLVTNSTKAVQWRWGYSAFGDTLPVSINATTLNLRYPGQYYDAESKLHYNINRYYDPVTGRYTQSDLIGLKSGINTYGYVGGNLIGYMDPTGLVVMIVTKDKAAYKKIQNSYAKVNQTKRGREICEKLENSDTVYQIKPITKDAFYCVSNSTAKACLGKNALSTYVDPYNDLVLPTTNGPQTTPLWVILGHELGHANGELDDGINQMNNVNTNENPMRSQAGLPLRNSYVVDTIKWVPSK
jgi:RHS repeat-associated protein